MHYVILAYLLIYVIPSIILDILQMLHIKSHSKLEPVILNKEGYKIAANYALIRQNISIAHHVFEAVVVFAWLLFGIELIYNFWATYTNNQFLHDWLNIMSFILISSIINIPFDIIQKKIDKAYGFNRQSVKSIFADFVKEFILSSVIFALIFGLLLWIMKSIVNWWFLCFVSIFCLIILMQLIYPTLIAPIFNKFTPLENQNLADKINNLMQRAGFKSNGIFVMDASRRDGRLNAYFGGLGASKRVVLFDTLLEKISEDGLLAVLGHELGHFRNKDTIKQIILFGFILFMCFAIIGLFFDKLCIYLGFESSNSAILILAILLLPALKFAILPIINYFSRKAEYKADEFGASMVSKKALSESLIKLVNENKSFPYSHPIYIFFYHSHPPLIERLKALKDSND